MNEKLTNYLNGVFASYEGVKSIADLKADLLVDLQDRFRDLKTEGKDDETAFAMTIGSIGNIEQTVLEVANLSSSLERQVLTSFNAANLTKSDFAGVTAHNTKYKASALQGSDFSGADLTGSLFRVSDASQSNFTGTNLTDCTLSITNLSEAQFHKTILVRTEFDKSDLTRARFTDVQLTDVKLTMTDLRETIFENCSFRGVDFRYCDLRGKHLDGLTFIGVQFDGSSLNEATFQGATLKNVSIKPAFALTNKNYLALQTIRWEGALMDKLTYVGLKGLGVDLSKVTVI